MLQQLYFIILKIIYIFIRPWLLLGRNDFFEFFTKNFCDLMIPEPLFIRGD
ncbi:Uncharacterized protein LB4E_2662 [Leptospira borgpetersenii str. 4E]|nr:Uncharacterized protein LB4E_2662 [Leptospira borgpetersenii str. 4E]